jgi:hypothetical protein
VSVKVTGSLSGFTTVSKTSASTAVVAAASLVTDTPTISGTPNVGSKLTAVPGAAWGPAPVTFKYQWYRAGTAISGATSSSYTLTAASLNKAIKVKVTGSKTGYTSAGLVSAQTAAVGKGDFTSAPTPTVSGFLAVGSKLTAAHGTWAPSTSLTYKYQWYRAASGGDPVAISGATSSTRTLVSADAGSAILVKVTVSKTSYNTTPSTSAPTTAVWTVGAVKVSGSPKVAGTLTAATVAGAWTSGATLTYAWFNSAHPTTPIAGATGTTYSPTSADKGHTLKVTVTGTLSGYAPASVSSSSTATVS